MPVSTATTAWFIVSLFMFVVLIVKLRACISLRKQLVAGQSANAELSEQRKSLEKQLQALQLRFSSVLDVDKEIDRLRTEAATVEREAEQFKSRSEAEKIQINNEVVSTREKWSNEFESTTKELEQLSAQVDRLRGLAEMQDYGLYEPIFDFDTSDDYKDAVNSVRQRQKKMIETDMAAVCDTTWTVEGSAAKGKDMTRRYTKLQLRAFNGECEAAIAKARFDNVQQLKERIHKSWEAVNSLGKTNQVRITHGYRDLKVEELQLAYELARKKEQEKEEQRAIRVQMKEEEDARKEIEKAQKEAEADEVRYAKALESARKEIAGARDDKQEALKKKIFLLEQQFEEAHERRSKAISRAQLTRSGHIYVISNLGSFGNDVFKIGMTRRLEPIDRVNELGGASVPFRFDVHAMVYSEDAPALEGSIHRKFAGRQLNRVNSRREFFRVTLDEIEATVKELCGKEADFVRTAVAEEYRESEAIRLKEEMERQAINRVLVDTAVAQAKDRLAELRETWKAEPIG